MTRLANTLLLLLMAAVAQARSIDEIRRTLESASTLQMQEKVYVHTDNMCYFIGDTLWYKAYVVRASDLRLTDMSRILYVELLSPDGLVVERQQVVVGERGYSCGQFCLHDSLYSGYYELRAYTRWMLNFNVDHRRYSRQDTWAFYNAQMAADYYRTWDGLYSRTLPVYSKPEVAGDYDARRMYQRPKQRIPKPLPERLKVTFYPEGGHLVEGVDNRVAFDVADQNGEAVDISGTLAGADGQTSTIGTQHNGRGLFTVKPTGRRLTARFRWRGKDYDFPLPEAERSGVAVRLDGSRLAVAGRRLPADRDYGVSVLCRGVLRHFAALPALSAGGEAVSTTVELPLDSLPTGVCDVTLFDDRGQVLADRLFFVGQGGVVASLAGGGATAAADAPVALVGSSAEPTRTYRPYEAVSIAVEAPPSSVFSLSVRDARTDEPTYDDGNLATDLLLSSELRGFVARPAYYFEADDERHRAHLDLLMMVQGWRKYKWRELADTLYNHRRYEPEKSLTVSGAVYRALSVPEVDPQEIRNWQEGVGKVGAKLLDDDDDTDDEAADDGLYSTDDIAATATDDDTAIAYGSLESANDELGVNHASLKRDVLIEAEVVFGRDVVAAVQKTQRGRYLFQVPPFYGDAILNMKAYKEKDSLKKAMTSRRDATAYNEDAYPDFYVKRDLPYPASTRKYGYYQNHAPEWQVTIDVDSLSDLSMENDVHQLQNVNVRGRRRGTRGVDWTKPAYVCDAYELYNTLTDYGLSFGWFDMRQFPLQVARFLYGNMNRYNTVRVDGRLNRQTYWRNYSYVTDNSTSNAAPGLERAARRWDNRSPVALYNQLKLSRLEDIRVYSDYEPRNPDSTQVENRYMADATVEMVPYADDARQMVFRDRHIVLHGFNEPADFYQPDYSQRQPDAPADYRRTLYWNPNAVADADGRFTATFYNNARDTRIKISAAGISPDGRLMVGR